MDVEKLLLQLDEKEAELIEFQESSRALEEELQRCLDSSEKRNRSLEAANDRLQRENEELKEKFSREREELICRVEELTHDLESERSRNKTLSDVIRNLEQMNDDLERSKRALVVTLEDFESKFNSQIEKNVLLESELGEKSELEAVIQRLKDEARDLRSELLVQQQKRMSITESATSSSPASSHHTQSQCLTNANSSTQNNSPHNSSNCHSKSNRPVGGIRPPNSIPVRSHFSPSSFNHNYNSSSSNNHSNHHNNTHNNSSSCSSPRNSNNNNILNSLSKTTTTTNTTANATSSASSPTTKSPGVTSPVWNGSSVTTPRHRKSSSGSAAVISNGCLPNGLTNGQSTPVRDPLPLLSPNTRNSALNIVSDLLRKVGDLESKLASCRNIVPQTCRNPSEV